MKRLLIQILPYFVALTAGVLLYLFGVDLVQDADLNNMIINIASGLISIPMVFICYDVVNKITSRKLHNSLFMNVTFDINGYLIQLINTVRGLLGKKDALTAQSMNAFLDLGSIEINELLQINSQAAQVLDDIKNKLGDIIHKDTTLEILSEGQITTLLDVTKNAGLLAKGIEYAITHKSLKHKKNLVMNVERIVDSISTWLEDGEREALEDHAQFKFNETPADTTKESVITSKSVNV